MRTDVFIPPEKLKNFDAKDVQNLEAEKSPFFFKLPNILDQEWKGNWRSFIDEGETLLTVWTTVANDSKEKRDTYYLGKVKSISEDGKTLNMTWAENGDSGNITSFLFSEYKDSKAAVDFSYVVNPTAQSDDEIPENGSIAEYFGGEAKWKGELEKWTWEWAQELKGEADYKEELKTLTDEKLWDAIQKTVDSAGHRIKFRTWEAANLQFGGENDAKSIREILDGKSNKWVMRVSRQLKSAFQDFAHLRQSGDFSATTKRMNWLVMFLGIAITSREMSLSQEPNLEGERFSENKAAQEIVLNEEDDEEDFKKKVVEAMTQMSTRMKKLEDSNKALSNSNKALSKRVKDLEKDKIQLTKQLEKQKENKKNTPWAATMQGEGAIEVKAVDMPAVDNNCFYQLIHKVKEQRNNPRQLSDLKKVKRCVAKNGQLMRRKVGVMVAKVWNQIPDDKKAFYLDKDMKHPLTGENLDTTDKWISAIMLTNMSGGWPEALVISKTWEVEFRIAQQGEEKAISTWDTAGFPKDKKRQVVVLKLITGRDGAGHQNGHYQLMGATRRKGPFQYVFSSEDPILKEMEKSALGNQHLFEDFKKEAKKDLDRAADKLIQRLEDAKSKPSEEKKVEFDMTDEPTETSKLKQMQKEIELLKEWKKESKKEWKTASRMKRNKNSKRQLDDEKDYEENPLSALVMFAEKSTEKAIKIIIKKCPDTRSLIDEEASFKFNTRNVIGIVAKSKRKKDRLQEMLGELKEKGVLRIANFKSGKARHKK